MLASLMLSLCVSTAQSVGLPTTRSAALAGVRRDELELRLPAPSGPYAVGTNFLLCLDESRAEGEEGRPRPILAQVWYPAAPTPGKPMTSYVGLALREAMKAVRYLDQEEAVIDAWGTVPTQAHIGAPVALEALPLPVVLLSHELGLSHHQYTALGQELASHGFAVFALDHPHGGLVALSDGRVLTLPPEIDPSSPEVLEALAAAWGRDLGLVLDRLEGLPGTETPIAGHLRLDRVAVLGHALGGAAALEAAGLDRRIAAAVVFQVSPSTGLQKRGLRVPTLVLLGGPPDLDPSTRGNQGDQRESPSTLWQDLTLVHAGRGATLALVSIQDADSLSFSDCPFVLRGANRPFSPWSDPRLTFEVISALVRAFLDEHLRAGDWRGLQEGAKSRIGVSLEILGG